MNFVPYLGLATNAADGIEAASTGDKSAGLRVALDAGISAATTARYGLGIYKGAKYLATNPIINRPDRARKPGVVLSFPFVGAAAALPMAYANDIAKRQAYADVEYADTPLRDMAKKKYPQFFE